MVDVDRNDVMHTVQHTRQLLLELLEDLLGSVARVLQACCKSVTIWLGESQGSVIHILQNYHKSVTRV
jgi:hypothetical protein